MTTRVISPEAELFVRTLEELEALDSATGAETGACLISTPGHPAPTCAMLTREQCRAIGGAYVGGACPAFEASEPIGLAAVGGSDPAISTASGASAVTCTYGGKTYSEGSKLCWGGKQHECTKNGWVNLGFKC